MKNVDCDVVIIGSGMVGNTLACTLLQAGLHVIIVEARPFADIDIEKRDLRTFAITRASEQIFKNIGVWDKMLALRTSPFRKMHVWDANGQGNIHFDSANIHEPTLGHIVEQSIIQKSLTTRLAAFVETGNLIYHRPAKIQDFTVDEDNDVIHTTLDTGITLTAKLLVSAEGANASIRELAGIPYNVHDYGQQAIVANVQTTLPHQETAWQRFLETGPLAFLPLNDEHMCSIVWSVDTIESRRLMALDEKTFLAELTTAFESKLGTVIDLDQRAAFPLKRRHVHHYIKPRLALVGDAAHTVHPLAGQGVNLGLLDVATLGELIIETHKAHQDFGCHQILRRYERQRKAHNLLVMSAMTGFKYLFGSTLTPLKWARNVGLTVTDSLTPVKKVIMTQAMGLDGDLPTMARFLR